MTGLPSRQPGLQFETNMRWHSRSNFPERHLESALLPRCRLRLARCQSEVREATCQYAVQALRLPVGCEKLSIVHQSVALLTFRANCRDGGKVKEIR